MSLFGTICISSPASPSHEPPPPMSVGDHLDWGAWGFLTECLLLFRKILARFLQIPLEIWGDQKFEGHTYPFLYTYAPLQPLGKYLKDLKYTSHCIQHRTEEMGTLAGIHLWSSLQGHWRANHRIADPNGQIQGERVLSLRVLLPRCEEWTFSF